MGKNPYNLANDVEPQENNAAVEVVDGANNKGNLGRSESAERPLKADLKDLGAADSPPPGKSLAEQENTNCTNDKQEAAAAEPRRGYTAAARAVPAYREADHQARCQLQKAWQSAAFSARLDQQKARV
jgi:hypothetical protein